MSGGARLTPNPKFERRTGPIPPIALDRLINHERHDEPGDDGLVFVASTGAPLVAAEHVPVWVRQGFDIAIYA